MPYFFDFREHVLGNFLQNISGLRYSLLYYMENIRVTCYLLKNNAEYECYILVWHATIYNTLTELLITVIYFGFDIKILHVERYGVVNAANLC